jgi:hypothetical protein
VDVALDLCDQRTRSFTERNGVDNCRFRLRSQFLTPLAQGGVLARFLV